MKHIKLFENFNRSVLIRELDKYGIKNYTINSDVTIDVDGDVDLSTRKLNKIPFKFGEVTGNFECDSNALESLEGSPYYVGGDFYCNNNNLTNLIGCPKEIGRNFCCSDNKLINIEGMPVEIGKDFDCLGNPNLKTLDSISNIEGNIYCDENIDITKFIGSCKEIIKQ